MFINKIKNETVLARSIVQLNQLTLPPNQSLKLTEPAVGDFARAKQPVTCWTGLGSRGLDSVAAALRRRSLAPVR